MIKNLKKLKNISVFRIFIIFIINVYLESIYICLLSILYLFITSKKDLILFLIILILYILLINKTDFIKFGIVEYETENYYIINKLLYKTKINKSNNIFVGDIIKSINFVENNKTSDLKQNILFLNKDYIKLYSLNFKQKIYQYICKQNSFVKSYLLKTLYDINNYEEDYLINVSTITILNKIYKINNKLIIILILTLSIIFANQVKFLLFYIVFFLDIFNLDKDIKFIFKYIIILLINKNFIYNYSLIISFLFELYNYINIKVSFNQYLSIIQSMFFSSINIIYLFLYKFLIKFNLLLLIFILSSILFKIDISNIISFVDFLFNIIDKITIRGKINYFILIICLLINRIINNEYLKLIILYLLIISPFNSISNEVTFIDVGHGDAILIKSPFNNFNVLIDTGSKYNYYKLKKYLFSKSIYKIDYLIITHNDTDHNGNIENLVKDFIINKIITEGKDINKKYLSLNYLFLDNFNNDNDNSLVYELYLNDYSFIFTGDISKDVERILIKKYGNINYDVLKVSHHGSKTATSKYFLANILPKFAIISTSGQYNHPSKETINNLNNYLIEIFNTKEDGNISFYLGNLISFIKTDNEIILLK